MSTRRGFTLAELLVGMVVLGIIGAALSRLLLSQSRFYDLQTQLRRARFVSRTAINAALSDLRMVEATGGDPAGAVRAGGRMYEHGGADDPVALARGFHRVCDGLVLRLRVA